MTGRSRTFAVIAVVLLVPAVVILYSLACQALGQVLEPIIAPTPAVLVIHHYHVEGFLVAAFLGIALLWRMRRTVVWAVAAIILPILPELLLRLAVNAPAMPRTEAQDFTLWMAEGVGAGVLCCLVWEAVNQLLHRPHHGTGMAEQIAQ